MPLNPDRYFYRLVSRMLRMLPLDVLLQILKVQVNGGQTVQEGGVFGGGHGSLVITL